MTSRLHACVDGPADAPVLLLGSSLGTSGAMWQPQLPALTRHHRVVRYDHLGHGDSDVPAGPYTIADLGRAVLRLLDDLAVPKVSYAGLSLGGMVGMWLAANAPDRIDRLVLLCTSAWLGPAQGWRERAAATRAGGVETIADVVVGRWFTRGFAADRPEVVAAYRAMLAATPPEGYAGCCEAIAGMDLRDDLARITAPTLVIAGAHDPATPIEHARVLADGIPAAGLRVVGDAAHLANVEQPDRVGRLILDHLGTEPTRSGPAGGDVAGGDATGGDVVGGDAIGGDVVGGDAIGSDSTGSDFVERDPGEDGRPVRSGGKERVDG
ncbi:3-oxoadipate enol-lactonase [Plantactinospora endophytica]|uniref:3-oxoadipate enol-lactonase n=1 Tax=Plantactinospora endophytica TaxID=673535 RepID=A0ABQ4E930_9ACTN|nr:3-oxoadipate enol-lactonase [Plantactinospora endophytica]GIG91223.1 3-oxoadipate enol-lactonase [Plantactinospora endophytica]